MRMAGDASRTDGHPPAVRTKTKIHRVLAQLVEQRSPKPRVGSSSLSYPVQEVSKQIPRERHFFPRKTPMFRKLSQFISAIKSELKKCSWPWESDPKIKGFKKFRELWGSTLVVLIAMVLLGAYVAFFDFVMARVVTWAVEQLS